MLIAAERAEHKVPPSQPKLTADRQERARHKAAETRARRELAHPLTSEELVYTDAEFEFMMAVRAYQERTGRKFPTTREILHVLHGLGYRKD